MSFKKGLLTLIFGLLLPTYVWGFTDEQEDLMEYAYKAGEPYDLSKTMVAILYQESKAGKLNKVGDIDNGFGNRSLGVMQIKLRTAEHMIDVCDHLDRGHKTKEEIIADLINDDQWNIQVGACFLKWSKEHTSNWREAVLAYNQGLTGSEIHDIKDHPYVLSIVEHITSDYVSDWIDEFEEENAL